MYSFVCPRLTSFVKKREKAKRMSPYDSFAKTLTSKKSKPRQHYHTRTRPYQQQHRRRMYHLYHPAKSSRGSARKSVDSPKPEQHHYYYQPNANVENMQHSRLSDVRPKEREEGGGQAWLIIPKTKRTIKHILGNYRCHYQHHPTLPQSTRINQSPFFSTRAP